MTSLLERCRPSQPASSENQPIRAVDQSSPFFNYLKQFLHRIATIVPYESMLCALAQCRDKQVAERYIKILQQLNAEFPFSVTTYVGLFLAVFKLQHLSSIDNSLYDQLPFEVCAYFTWMKSKSEYSKAILPKIAVNLFSETIFDDQYMFGFRESFGSNAVYLREMAQDSLRQVHSLSEVEAISSKTAAQLYNLSYTLQPASPSAAKEGPRHLKSPIKVIVEAREALNQNNDGSALQDTDFYERTLKVLHYARYIQIDLCIDILCSFIYQHVQIPFKETNPVNIWKRILYLIAPYADVFKDSSDFWSSMVNRCQKAICKGSEVAERTYHGKLEFLVTTIDDEAKAQTSSAVSEYTLEKKLKELCSNREIDAETSVDQMVRTWQTLFKDCRIANVVPSHRGLIARWMKWSLTVHELRLTLEKHITIAIPGLVNSGKTQLIRSLFGFNVWI